ncbi:MAG: tripartite tricarboxylate transporter substrate binding protein [Pseudomonadota bacterium]
MFHRFAQPCLIATLVATAAISHAQQDNFPSRPITLVAPFPAGSVTDSVTRIVGQAMQEVLGQTVVVDNRAGAQGTVGAAYVARAKPDGYTLLMASSGMFVAKSFYKSLTYDPTEAFQPVSGIGSTSMMFMVAQDSPYKSMADLTREAKSGKPVTVAFGSPSGQLALALYSAAAQVSPVPVSYRGIPQALTDLGGGHVNVAVVDIGSGVAQMNSGKMRPIAISARGRSTAAPEVPTMEEVFRGGGNSLETLIAIMAPAGTPKSVVDKLDNAVRTALSRTAVKARFQALTTSVVPLSADELTKRIRDDNPKWEALIKKAGIEQQ